MFDFGINIKKNLNYPNTICLNSITFNNSTFNLLR